MNNPLDISFDANGIHLIEANAGAGKTWTIERLFAKAVLAGYSVKSILVLTFSNSAAKELKHRIFTQLLHTKTILKGGNEKTDEFSEYIMFRNNKHDISLINHAIDGFDSSVICTIHSFANKILTENYIDYSFYSNKIINKRKFTGLITEYIKILINDKTYTSHYNVLHNINILFPATFPFNNKGLAERIADLIQDDFYYFFNGKPVPKYQLEPINLEVLNEKLKEKSPTIKATILYKCIEYITENIYRIVKNDATYNELIAKLADELVGKSEGVYQTFPVMFIDEFQDTDEFQWRIFNEIYHIETDQRGKVVLVADPKQAIYSFRGADIAVYNNAKKYIHSKYILNKNFRSHVNIVNFLNSIFAEKDIFGSEIEYCNSVPTIFHSNYNETDTEFTDEVQIVAVNSEERLFVAIASEIICLLPKHANQIAVLAYTNFQSEQICNYLKQHKINAIQVKPNNIFSHKVAIELYELLDSLSDIHDYKKFLKSLNTSIMGFCIHYSDQDALNKLQEQFYEYSKIINSKGYMSFMYSLLKDREYVQYADEILELIEYIEVECYGFNILEVIYFVQKMIENTSVMNDDMIVANGDVYVMTQHRAKGLEYDVVFCPYFAMHDDIKLPFFYRHKIIHNVLDTKEIHKELKEEKHRLNYVALSRAKERIYIYLTPPIYAKTKKSNTKLPILAELFGFNHQNQNFEHELFNYNQFFNQQQSAIKKDMIGVVCYQKHDIKITSDNIKTYKQFKTENDVFYDCNKLVYQSYSGITKAEAEHKDFIEKVQYKYSLLSENKIGNREFGLLLHKCLENTELNERYINHVLGANSYPQMRDIVQAVLDHKILDNKSLSELRVNGVSEMEFMLSIDYINMNDLKGLIQSYFGGEHPFSIAVMKLNEIKAGFLSGAIDLCVKHDDMYWIIDYKSNEIAYYDECYNKTTDSPIIESMAKHHYYLQYLLYLVALKRHIEDKLNISDGTELIGGALFYYIRGALLDNPSPSVYIDIQCRELIKDLDLTIGYITPDMDCF